MTNSSMIVGAGEIGRALYRVLLPHYVDTQIRDIENINPVEKVDILHIAFPYSDGFYEQVKGYQQMYRPLHTIIHSTVPVGTSSTLGAVHSPVRGIHPNLEGGIRTFVKFLGGADASGVADYFRRAGMRVMLFDKAETTEAMKLFDTEYYRVTIEFAHRVKAYCDKHNLNYSDVYRVANATYNEGYAALGHPEFVRPILEPIAGVIRGHCVLPNKELIKLSEGKTE